MAVDDTRVVGWIAASAVSDRSCYGGVVEHSVYVDPDYQGKGIGKALLDFLIERSTAAGVWTIQTGIFPENTASVTLHQASGFRTVGRRERPVNSTEHGETCSFSNAERLRRRGLSVDVEADDERPARGRHSPERGRPTFTTGTLEPPSNVSDSTPDGQTFATPFGEVSSTPGRRHNRCCGEASGSAWEQSGAGPRGGRRSVARASRKLVLHPLRVTSASLRLSRYSGGPSELPPHCRGHDTRPSSPRLQNQ